MLGGETSGAREQLYNKRSLLVCYVYILIRTEKLVTQDSVNADSDSMQIAVDTHDIVNLNPLTVQSYNPAWKTRESKNHTRDLGQFTWIHEAGRV